MNKKSLKFLSYSKLMECLDVNCNRAWTYCSKTILENSVPFATAS